MIKDLLTHPSPNEEVEILSRLDSGVFDKDSVPAASCTLEDVMTMQRYARTIYIDPSITRYLVELVHATRNTQKYLGRLSPTSSTVRARAPRSPSPTPAARWR